MSTVENCLISTYLLCFSTRVHMKKNGGDTPYASLTNQKGTINDLYNLIKHLIFQPTCLNV